MLRVDDVKPGRITINGQAYPRDIVISNNATISFREARSSQALTERYGHTPLTTAENIPWSCEKLVIGTGFAGRLVVTEEVRSLAYEMGVQLICKPTPQALTHINDKNTNLLLHIGS